MISDIKYQPDHYIDGLKEKKDEMMKNHSNRIIYIMAFCLVMILMGATSASAAESTVAAAASTQDAAVLTEGDPGTDAVIQGAAVLTEGEASSLPSTTISGVPAKLSRNASSKVSFTVKVTPANGTRTVKLQQYISSSKTWRTRATYHTTDQTKASVKVTLAKKYRKKTTGKWRVYVPATDQAAAAVSRTFTVTSRNIKTKKLGSWSACVYCIDDKTLLYTKKHKTRRSPASTTKLMSAIILVESGKLNGKTKISANAANTPWGSGMLKKGDKYRNIDLLYAMLLPSSNDAAVAVAEGVSGSTGEFVKKMNEKAQKMGLKKTHFCNPHGLHDNNHYTTAYALAKLTAYAYNIEEIRDAMQTRTRTITSIRYNRTWKLYSSDSLLGTIKNFFGGKTGTGEDAKYCFTGVYKYKGKTYVTVTLRASSPAKRWNDTRKLHSYIRKYAATKY